MTFFPILGLLVKCKVENVPSQKTKIRKPEKLIQENEYEYFQYDDYDHQMNNEDAIYEDMEDVYFYEDFEYSHDGVDYDMNFDKVTVFSHVNAPSGQT